MRSVHTLLLASYLICYVTNNPQARQRNKLMDARKASVCSAVFVKTFTTCCVLGLHYNRVGEF